MRDPLDGSIIGEALRACPDGQPADRMVRGFIAMTSLHHACFIRNLGGHPWPSLDQQDLPLSQIHTAVKKEPTDGV